jgi:uncharacterized membrane protein YhfC
MNKSAMPATRPIFLIRSIGDHLFFNWFSSFYRVHVKCESVFLLKEERASSEALSSFRISFFVSVPSPAAR